MCGWVDVCVWVQRAVAALLWQQCEPGSLQGLSAWVCKCCFQDYYEAFLTNKWVDSEWKDRRGCGGGDFLKVMRWVHISSFRWSSISSQIRLKYAAGGSSTRSHVCLNLQELAETVLHREAPLCIAAAHFLPQNIICRVEFVSCYWPRWQLQHQTKRSDSALVSLTKLLSLRSVRTDNQTSLSDCTSWVSSFKSDILGAKCLVRGEIPTY